MDDYATEHEEMERVLNHPDQVRIRELEDMVETAAALLHYIYPAIAGYVIQLQSLRGTELEPRYHEWATIADRVYHAQISLEQGHDRLPRPARS